MITRAGSLKPSSSNYLPNTLGIACSLRVKVHNTLKEHTSTTKERDGRCAVSFFDYRVWGLPAIAACAAVASWATVTVVTATAGAARPATGRAWAWAWASAAAAVAATAAR